MSNNQFKGTLTEEQRDSVQLPHTLRAIQQAKISKEANDAVLHPLLTAAIDELKKLSADVQQESITMFIRNLFFCFSIQREHNYWKEDCIKAPVSGAQMRTAGRSILRWMHDNPLMKEWLQRRDENGLLKEYKLVVEHANFGILFHNEITTGVMANGKRVKGSKANPARKIKAEVQNTPLHIKVQLSAQYVRAGKHLSLLARFLPKIETGKNRYTTLIVGQSYKGKSFDTKGKQWVKLNGVQQDGKFDVKDGDVIRYPRPIGKDAKERIATDMLFIDAFCKEMGWSHKEYSAFRHQHMQNTPEHKFSSGTITSMNKEQFMKWLGSLSGGQQHVVSTHLVYANESKQLVANPKGKWYNTDLPQWCLEFNRKEEKVAKQARELMDKGDTEGAKRLVEAKAKTKTAGVQSIDLFTDLMTQKKSVQEIDTAYTVLTTKMNMVVPVYCCVDCSGSMGSTIRINNLDIPMLDVALVLALTFMLTNPIKELGESCMWYGGEAEFTGVTKYKYQDLSNRYVVREKLATEARKIIDRTKGFYWNFHSLKSANPGLVANTNPGKVIETFIQLIERSQMKTEDLPQVLLFLTDDCGNSGMSPREFMAKANSIGWNPLFVFWGIQDTRNLKQYEGAPNVLVERGFSENSLSNILQFITKGSINMYDSLWSVYDNPAYQAVKY